MPIMSDSYGGYRPPTALGSAPSLYGSSSSASVMSPGDPRYPFLKYGYRTEAEAIAAGWKPTAAETAAGYTPSAAATGGGTAGSTGSGTINTGNSTIDQLIAEYQKAYEEAKADNLKRYEEAMAIANQGQAIYDKTAADYERQYAEQLGLLEGLGEGAKSEARRSYGANEGSIYSNLVSRGMSGTTILPTLLTGNTEAMNRSLNDIQESINAQKLGVVQGQTAMTNNLASLQQAIDAQKLGVITGREDTYPNQEALLNLIQALGAYQNAGSVYTPPVHIGGNGSSSSSGAKKSSAGQLDPLPQPLPTVAHDTSKKTTPTGNAGGTLNLTGSGIIGGMQNLQNSNLDNAADSFLIDYYGGMEDDAWNDWFMQDFDQPASGGSSSSVYTPTQYASPGLQNLYDYLDNPYSYLYQ